MKTIVIHPIIKRQRLPDSRPPDVKLAECIGLARAIDLDVVSSSVVTVSMIKPSHYIGSGILQIIADQIVEHQAGLLVIDTALSPLQQRNLERDLKIKVLDRTGIILEIFGARAKTFEGKLQVEMASLTFQRSRLVRSWTHLERQRGGFGFLGGPGESQLEIDRRLIDNRLRRLKTDLAKVKQNRTLQRANRPYPVIALIGYTNVGKSTLFNNLTGGNVLAKDMMFATLDPTLRLLQLPSSQRVILSDTVGFISDLPTSLVAAFRATLDDVKAADIILHLHDASSKWHQDQSRDVNTVLSDLNIAPDSDNIVHVWNKCDEIGSDLIQDLFLGDNDFLISATINTGIGELLQRLDKMLLEKRTRITVFCDFADSQKRSWLYEHGANTTQEKTQSGYNITTYLRTEDIPPNFK